MNRTIALLSLFVLPVAAHAEEGSLPSEATTLMRALEGKWAGPGSFVMGEESVPLQITLQCSSASFGHAALCLDTSKGPDGVLHGGTNLFGWDTVQKKLHLYSVTDSGEVHDHVGTIAADGKSAHVRVEQTTPDGAYLEVIDLVLRGKNELSFKSVVTVAGKDAGTFSADIKR